MESHRVGTGCLTRLVCGPALSTTNHENCAGDDRAAFFKHACGRPFAPFHYSPTPCSLPPPYSALLRPTVARPTTFTAHQIQQLHRHRHCYFVVAAPPTPAFAVLSSASTAQSLPKALTFRALPSLDQSAAQQATVHLQLQSLNLRVVQSCF